MAAAPSPSTAQPAELEPAELEPAPLLLPWDLLLTPEQYSCGEDFVYERVRQANPEAVLELAADGALIAMTPTGGEERRERGACVWASGFWPGPMDQVPVPGSPSTAPRASDLPMVRC